MKLVDLQSDCNPQERVNGARFNVFAQQVAASSYLFNVFAQQVAASSYLVDVCDGVTDIIIKHPNYVDKQVSVHDLSNVSMTCSRKYMNVLSLRNQVHRRLSNGCVDLSK